MDNLLIGGLIGVIFLFLLFANISINPTKVTEQTSKQPLILYQYATKETPENSWKPIPAKKEPTVIKEDINCLARNIYHEARGEDLKEQISVGRVVLNRMKDQRYPDSVCGVVYQPYQFSWTMDRSKRITEWKSWTIAVDLAKKLLAGKIKQDYTNGATHYHTREINPHWSKYGKGKVYLTSHVYMKVYN